MAIVYPELQIGFEFRGKRYNSAAAGLAVLAAGMATAPDRMAASLASDMRTYLDSVAGALAQHHGNPWPTGTGTATLSKRSGQLIASIKESVAVYGETLGTLEGQIGGAFYARVHEYGATIRVKRAKFLTIPLPAALNSDGTPKKKSARDWHNTRIITSKKGNLLIVQTRGREIVPLYVLKKEVKIPARLNMGNFIETGMPYFVDTAIDNMHRAVIEAMSGAT